MGVTKVEYYHEGILIDTRLSEPFNYIKWNASEGDYQLTAKVWVDGVLKDTSQIVNFKAILPYPNTFIGNGASLYSTKEALALDLGISALNIKTFSIVGNEVQALITQKYTISDQLFRNTGITYYEDLGGKVLSGGGGSWFRDNPGFKLAVLPNVDYVTDINSYNSVFNNIDADAQLIVSGAAATINSGVPDPDFTQDGYNVTYRQNTTKPSAVSDLTSGTIYATAIQLNFTTPSSVNTILEYHIYNGTIRLGKIKNSGDFITGLQPSTNYNLKIVTVDEFYNKSETSQVVSATTTTTLIETANLVASYSFEKTTGAVLDLANGNHGNISGTVNRGVAGIVSTGNCFDFQGGKVVIPYRSSLNIGSKNFAFSFWINWSSINNTAFFNKRAGTTYEYQLYYANGDLILIFFNTDGTFFTWTFNPGFVVGTNYHIAGRLVGGTIEVKINNVVKNGTISESRKTLNITATDLTVGESVWNGNKFLGKMDELRFWIGDTVPNNFDNEWNNGNGITL